jgi:hypothetical protein
MNALHLCRRMPPPGPSMRDRRRFARHRSIPEMAPVVAAFRPNLAILPLLSLSCPQMSDSKVTISEAVTSLCDANHVVREAGNGLEHSFYWATGSASQRTLHLIRLQSESGLLGRGECLHPLAAILIQQHFGPHLARLDSADSKIGPGGVRQGLRVPSDMTDASCRRIWSTRTPHTNFRKSPSRFDLRPTAIAKMMTIGASSMTTPHLKIPDHMMSFSSMALNNSSTDRSLNWPPFRSISSTRTAEHGSRRRKT